MEDQKINVANIEMSEDMAYSGDYTVETRIVFTHYDKVSFSSREVRKIDDIHLVDNHINWIHIVGLNNIHVIQDLGKFVSLHPMVIEDILSVDQRTKAENYSDFLFVVADTVQYAKYNKLEFDQISFLLTPKLVISIDEKESHVFHDIRNKLRSGNRYRQEKTGDLLFALMDELVDDYFVIIDTLAEQLDVLEDELLEKPTNQTLHQLYEQKKNLIFLHKSLWPLRNVVSAMTKSQFTMLEGNTIEYFRDVYDHIIQLIDLVETFREVTSGMIDTHISSIGHRTNEVMKVLTLWSTIFMPLTFLAGVYGMNFRYFPELNQKYSYPFFWLICLIIVFNLIRYFQKKGWL